MDFTEVIIKNLSSLDISDVLKIRNAINLLLGTDSLATVATDIKREKGLLHSVKYVKEMTGWSLVDSKAYCDNLLISNI